MKYFKRYLFQNFNLKMIQREIFNNKPIILDHIAHRTFKNDNLTREYLKNNKIFYLENDVYNFPNYNVQATWLNVNGDKFNNSYSNSIHQLNDKIKGTPRIFISTYKGVETDINLKNSKLDLDEINWHINNKHELLSYELYKNIFEKNQYLAWTLLFRNRINHIAIEVDDISDIYEKTKKKLKINNPKSPIQISEDGNLLQFSTKSGLYPCKFKEGYYEIPRNFVEFVERKNNREGFSEKNANIVFQSTYH